MYASPGVVVNGAKPLAHEALPGDVIEIPANDTLTLLPGGDQVKLEPRSSAVYTDQKQIELRNGTGTITTKAGVGTLVHQYAVVPVVQPTVYQVSWSNGRGRVWVREGEVRIDGCEKKLNVPKDTIADLGRDCKVGAYLHPSGGLWDKFTIPASIAAPSTPIICYYLCLEDESCEEKKGKLTQTNSKHD
jgi:hypothetical protein